MPIKRKYVVCVLVICSLFFSGLVEAITLSGKSIDPSNFITPEKNISNIYTTINAPSNLTAQSPEVGKIVLQWNDNSSNESGFKIERASGSDDIYFEIDYVSANTTSYEQSELSTYAVFPSETYSYRVKAFNSTKESAYSNEAWVTVKSEVASPSPPEALRAKALWDMGHWVLRLFWVDIADNENKYVVQRKQEGQAFKLVAELPTNSVKFDEDALHMERNVKFTYRVIAYNAGGAGVSNEVDIVLPDDLPETPEFNPPLAQGSNSIMLSWEDNSDNEDYFRIDRGGCQSIMTHTWTVAENYVVPANQTSYLIDSLNPMTAYHFQISAVNALGEKSFDPIDTYTGPPGPTSLTVQSVSGTQNRLAWSSSDSYGGFSIERKKAGQNYAEVATVSGGSREHIDPLLVPGTQYLYRIRSWTTYPYDSNKYYSDYSNEYNVTTPGQSTTNFTGLAGTNLQAKNIIKLKLGDKNYLVNGQTLQMDAAPIVQEGRTLLPIRYLTEPMGAVLLWDASAQKVTISLKEKKIELWIGKNDALVNGNRVMIDPGNPKVIPISVPPGRTMLPARFVSETLGCEVNWDQQTGSATITFPGE